MGRRLQKGISAAAAVVAAAADVDAAGQGRRRDSDREGGKTRGHLTEVKWAVRQSVRPSDATAVRISFPTCLRAMTIFGGPI